MKQDRLNAARILRQEVEKKKWAERKLRKDAVLHLRVEGDIMDRIKAEAAAREMSVSDLVRCHLVERFSGPPSEGGSPEYLLAANAFTDVVAMGENYCAVCNTVIPHGSKTRLACGPPPPARLVCGKCFDDLQSEIEERNKLSEGEE